MRFASCMAPNAEPLFIETANYVAEQIGVEASIAHDLDWQHRELGLDSGDIEIGWICGLPYVWKADLDAPAIELLAAPIMSAGRYGGRPVYFSDVMVRTDSDLRAFTDLSGLKWAYNEPRSHSGYSVVKAHLFDRGDKDGFFGQVVMAGSHENALEMILSGQVAAAAIDTTVYETALRLDPSLADELRVIEVLGPSPIPPWVISTEVASTQRAEIKQALTNMHHDKHGAEILKRHAVQRYSAVTDEFYDPIRVMDQKARQTQFGDEGLER